MRKGLWITGGIVAAFIAIGAVAGGESEDVSADTKPAATKSASPSSSAKSQADQFKAFVQKNGTANEKAAAKHVTKVQGASEQNDIMDTPEIYTDYPGGFTSEHSSDGKLLASAFADWKDSGNGLVTVYSAEGDILANGQF